MRHQIQERLTALGVADRVEVEVTFATPWTSERISPAGREQLRGSGFAPPVITSGSAGLDELAVLPIAECPYCGSRNTTIDNPFGPTLCRAIYPLRRVPAAVRAVQARLTGPPIASGAAGTLRSAQ